MIIRRISIRGDTFEVSSLNYYKRIDGLDYILVGLIKETNIIHKYSGIFTFDIYPEDFMDLFIRKISFNFYIKKINKYNMKSDKNTDENTDEDEHVELSIKIIGKRENSQDELNSNVMYVLSEKIISFNICHDYELIELDISKMIKEWQLYGKTKLTIEFSINTLNVAILINKKYKNKAFIKICCNNKKKYTFIRESKGEIDSKEPIEETEVTDKQEVIWETEEQGLIESEEVKRGQGLIGRTTERVVEQEQIGSTGEQGRIWSAVQYVNLGVMVAQAQFQKGQEISVNGIIPFDTTVIPFSGIVRNGGSFTLNMPGVYLVDWSVVVGGETTLGEISVSLKATKNKIVTSTVPSSLSAQLCGSSIVMVENITILTLTNTSTGVIKLSDTVSVQCHIRIARLTN